MSKNEALEALVNRVEELYLDLAKKKGLIH